MLLQLLRSVIGLTGFRSRLNWPQRVLVFFPRSRLQSDSRKVLICLLQEIALRFRAIERYKPPLTGAMNYYRQQSKPFFSGCPFSSMGGPLKRLRRFVQMPISNLTRYWIWLPN